MSDGIYPSQLWLLHKQECTHNKQNQKRSCHYLNTKQENALGSHNLAVVVLPAAVRCGQCGGALLQVPGLASALSGAGDGDGVDGVCVAVAGAVVSAAPPVS